LAKDLSARSDLALRTLSLQYADKCHSARKQDNQPLKSRTQTQNP
jgi:hypothetical protein